MSKNSVLFLWFMNYNRGWNQNNWITIIHYSLLFSPSYSLFILNVFVIFIIHFLNFYQFSFSNSLFVNYITKEVKTVILSNSYFSWLVTLTTHNTQEENRIAKTR